MHCKKEKPVVMSYVDKFVSLCSVCQKLVPQSHADPFKSIIAIGFMQRGQVCHTSKGSTQENAT